MSPFIPRRTETFTWLGKELYGHVEQKCTLITYWVIAIDKTIFLIYFIEISRPTPLMESANIGRRGTCSSKGYGEFNKFPFYISQTPLRSVNDQDLKSNLATEKNAISNDSIRDVNYLN